MHLTDHISDVQLNEYLDNETNEREQIESHLSTCDDCATRLSALQNLFLELESLPELELTHDLSALFVTKGQLTLQLPHWLTLIVFLQAALALIALIISIPFIETLIPQFDMNSLIAPLFEIQSLWTIWLDSLSAFEVPTLPTIPVVEMSSLLLALVGIFMLWIFGNGLLLRNQIRRR